MPELNSEQKGEKYVMDYLTENDENPILEKKGKHGKGVDITTSDGKWIDAKGYRGPESNVRIADQTRRKVEKAGKEDNFYIYRVYNMDSKPMESHKEKPKY